ncbi:hypothetical protein [Streptomyces sp. NPDC051219]|uniref:hypothetical protein n=1 Tax=Streptomyces sp. NPDC051219 TaxID=3155283 RepID=UPI0034157334
MSEREREREPERERGAGPEPGPGGAAGGGGLPAELRALGRRLDVPDVGGESMAERVLAQIIAESVPVPLPEPEAGAKPPRRRRRAWAWAWARRRWRSLTAGLCGVLAVLALTPPVRAAVADWFDFGGVEVRYDPSATPGTDDPAVPGCDGLPVREAARRAGFEPMLPGLLGAPDGASVSQDRKVLSLCWRTTSGGTIRVDQFPAAIDPAFAKMAPYRPEWVSPAGGGVGLWYPEPHLLAFTLLDRTGRPYSQSMRPVGPSLLWQHSETLTLRLEGVPDKTRALDIADSFGRPGT